MQQPGAGHAHGVLWAALPLISALASVLLLSSCDTSTKEAEDRTRHGEGAGPLSASVSKGGQSLNAPDRTPWHATYGSLVLCSQVGEPITLDGVRYDIRAQPLSIEPELRIVPTSSTTPPASTWAPVTARLGLPDAFDSDPRHLQGTLSADIAGHEIAGKCNANPLGTYTELLTVMTVGTQGGWVDGIAIDYEAAGQQYTLDVDWAYIACGSKTRGSHC